jgi:peptide/nickel transport system substrate-binding protein
VNNASQPGRRYQQKGVHGVRRPRTAARAVAVLAVLATAAAGCGGGGGSNNDKIEIGNKGVGAVRNASDVKGGELKIVSVDDVDSLDPARAYYAFAMNLMRLYTRTLVTFDAKPGEAGQVLVPDLATDTGKSSNANKTWTYTLKDGVKFEDGTPITSKDIKYAVERIFAQDVINGGPTYMIDFLQDEKNPYTGPYKDKDPNKLGLKAIQTPDDKTIVFNLNKPLPDFPYLLQLPGSSPVPRARDTGAQYQNKPVSSGPYKIATYVKDKQIQFVRNTNWDASTDTVRKALPDTISFTAGLSPQDIDNRIQAGDADVDAGMTGVQVPTQGQILKDATKAQQADAPITGFTRYFAINKKVAPLDNIECRKAIIYAANPATLQQGRGGEVAGGDIASQMYPPSLQGYKSYDPYELKSHRTGQVDKAKEALKKCGKPNGFDLNVAGPDQGKGVAVNEALQAALKRVGINVTIQKAAAAKYYSDFIGVPKGVAQKKLGVMQAGWGPDFPTPFGFFSAIVDGRKILAAGNSNYAEFNNPEANAAIDAALTKPTVADAYPEWQKVDKLAMDSAQYLPFVWDKALLYANPRVTNLYVTGGWGQYDFASMGVKK